MRCMYHIHTHTHTHRACQLVYQLTIGGIDKDAEVMVAIAVASHK